MLNETFSVIFKHRESILNLLIKTFLVWILSNIVVRTKFKLEISFMICSDLNSDINDAFGLILVYDDSIGVFSIRSFMVFWLGIIGITTNPTFSIHCIMLMIKTSTISTIVIVICRIVKSYSPH